MTAHHFSKYVGKELKDVDDAITAEATKLGLTVSVDDPEFPKNIDRDPKRLNLVVDKDFIITHTYIG